jgi:transposase-like protein
MVSRPRRSTTWSTWSRHSIATSKLSKSEVSGVCAELEEEVSAFRERSLDEVAYPYLFLGTRYCKARVNRRGGLPGGGDRHWGDRG